MSNDSEITREDFEYLLAWLDPEEDNAALKYEHIRLSLIRILTNRGCYEADIVADETMIFVTKKAREVAPEYVGDPALYFFGVCKFKHKEWLRKRSRPVPPPPEPAPDIEQECACVEECMAKLSSGDHDLFRRYHEKERREKINERSQLAEELGIGLNALRIRAHRIKSKLRSCVDDCLKQALAV